jgi:predicted DNA-binding transcriptional regulator AlpA
MITTRQAAKKLGISAKTLSHYVAVKKVFAPEIVNVGGMMVHSWSEEDVERLRKLLPKIANGRKTRYQKLREKQQAPARVPAPHKKKQTKKNQK